MNRYNRFCLPFMSGHKQHGLEILFIVAFVQSSSLRYLNETFTLAR